MKSLVRVHNTQILQKIEHSHVPVICEQVQAGTFPTEGQQAEGK